MLYRGCGYLSAKAINKVKALVEPRRDHIVLSKISEVRRVCVSPREGEKVSLNQRRNCRILVLGLISGPLERRLSGRMESTDAARRSSDRSSTSVFSLLTAASRERLCLSMAINLSEVVKHNCFFTCRTYIVNQYNSNYSCS